MNDGPEPDLYDLAVIGGGINGCGIARDAAGRGLKVFLCEMGDLASGTSSWSTKLIHGGLRYLEHYEFGLVRHALAEREVLWALAPHIVRPLRFVLPIEKGPRPAWLIRLGLFLYDHIGGRRLLPPTRTLDLARDPAGAPLKPGFSRAFEYSDCWVEDSRLVVLNAMDALERGAIVATGTRAVAGTREGGNWRLDLASRGGARSVVRAKALVNAAGPWVAEVLGARLGGQSAAGVRLVQGSHIVVPKLFDHERAYFFQNADGRIFFAIPFEQDFTLIGTTDRDYSGDPANVRITPEETDYLCAAANTYFARRIAPADVIWAYSGVRPLYDDGASKAQEATRDYVLALDAPAGSAPLLSVFGGKITTYRRLAEDALARLGPHLPAATGRPAGWTASHPLPGGDFPVEGFERLLSGLIARHPGLPAGLLRRLARAYGTRAAVVLGGASTLADLGEAFGADLTEAELRYLHREEWVRTADDALWRRSKLGLRLDAGQVARVETFLAGL